MSLSLLRFNFSPFRIDILRQRHARLSSSLHGQDLSPSPIPTGCLSFLRSLLSSCFVCDTTPPKYWVLSLPPLLFSLGKSKVPIRQPQWTPLRGIFFPPSFIFLMILISKIRSPTPPFLVPLCDTPLWMPSRNNYFFPNTSPLFLISYPSLLPLNTL